MRVDASVYPASVKTANSVYLKKIPTYNGLNLIGIGQYAFRRLAGYNIRSSNLAMYGLSKFDIERTNTKHALSYNTRPTNVVVYDKTATAPEEFPTIYGYLL